IVFSRESFTTEELFHFGVACVLSGAATLLNPYGIDYLLNTYNILTSEAYMGLQNKYVNAYVSLWPYLKDINIAFLSYRVTAWIMTLMIFSIFSLSIYELVKKRSCDFALLITSCALYWKGMETGRASYFFPIAFFFIFFYLLIHRLKLKSIPGKATIFSLLVFLFFFVNLSYFTIRYGGDNKWFGAGLDSFVPMKEVAFLKKYHLDGPIFNDYVIGGYLMWDLYPDYKVFIDPRGGSYNNRFFQDYMDFTTKPLTSEDIHSFTKKYPFKVAIIHYGNSPLIFEFLGSGDEWRLLYFEKNAAILIHKSLLPATLAKTGNINLSPMRFSGVKNPEVLLNVFKFYVHLDPKAGRYIYDVFKKNVSDYYKPKPDILQWMDINIRREEQGFQNKVNLPSP
ncbi:MAG: hypothetical protein WAN57_00865, partial [Smithella sp.]